MKFNYIKNAARTFGMLLLMTAVLIILVFRRVSPERNSISNSGILSRFP